MIRSLWSARWPRIALQECIDKVEQAAPDMQAEVAFGLPCQDCPENARCLNAKRKELGPLLYDREIQTSPRTSESSLFPYALMEPMLNRELACVPHWRKPFSMEHEWAVCSGWDVAWSERIGGDWMVKVTARVHRITGQRTILDVGRWQRLSFDEQMALIASEWGKYQDDLVVIESDAAQRIWQQHLSATTAVPVLQHPATGKQSFATGIPSLLIGLENRKWEIPYEQGSFHHENIQVWLAELEAFGWQDDKLQGVGEHDDTVMAWYHTAWGLDYLVQAGQNREQHVGVNSGRYI